MKTIPVSLILAGVLAPLGASAQPRDNPPPGRGTPGKPDPRRAAAEIWKRADKDGDGQVSREEFDAMPRIQKLPEDKRQRLFERLDSNGDGKLTRQEIHRHDHGEGGRQPLRRLAELDKDQSGGVSFEEMQAGPLFQKLSAERQMEIFRRLDTDNDGVLTPKDRPTAPEWRDRPEGHRMKPERQFKLMDKDGDGAVSFEEFQAAPHIAALSEDEQEDRFEEFQAAPHIAALSEDEQEDRFEALDRNKDQKLTLEEYQTKPRRPER